MGSDMPMILPKGIVVNTEDVYNEIASHKLVPFDRVWQVWRGESSLYLFLHRLNC